MHVHPGVDSMVTQTVIHLLREFLLVPLVGQHYMLLPHGSVLAILANGNVMHLFSAFPKLHMNYLKRIRS